jgi:pimeloyl-ACP methyl ester carboxylesterase
MKRGLTIALLVVLVVLLVGPLLVPVPPLEDTVAPHAACGQPVPRRRRCRRAFKSKGEGAPAFLLLHGFGASTFTWRAVWQDLALLGQTVAYDRPGFGITSRPLLWSGANPYAGATQPAIAMALLNALGIDRAVLVQLGGRSSHRHRIGRSRRSQRWCW